MTEAELGRQHAELHYGKYSAGYNRGCTRGADERMRLARQNAELMRFLRELDELNRQCDGDLLPSEYASRLADLIA